MVQLLFLLFQVNFKGEDGKAVSIMSLKIQPIPHVVDQTFRFNSPEQSFLKRSIRLPALDTLPGQSCDENIRYANHFGPCENLASIVKFDRKISYFKTILPIKTKLDLNISIQVVYFEIVSNDYSNHLTWLPLL